MISPAADMINGRAYQFNKDYNSAHLPINTLPVFTSLLKLNL